MAKPIVAVVGRPNVGKSTLFNYIIGQRIAIVEDTPGVTRDRIYAEGEWRSTKFDLIDTGGIEEKSDDTFAQKMIEQVNIAISAADVIMFITDIRQGVTEDDKNIALMLKKAKKPIVLVCNKVDSIGKTPDEIYEFYNLGLGDPYPVSSTNGLGIGDVLDALYQYFPEHNNEDDEDEIIKVAILGKPNTGKSSLVNKILKEERVIVSDIPGTTRDAVDSYFENTHGKYVFIDTAGIRKRKKVTDNIEKYSIMRTNFAIERSDVCLIMIDARDGVTDQDTKVAGLAHEAGKASIIVVNKWDLIEKSTGTMEDMRKTIMQDLSYMTYAPILFISALTGQRVNKLFDLINYVNEQTSMRISTGKLNSLLADAMLRVQPPSEKGRRLKIYYITQPGIRPPSFICYCNNTELFHFSYQRYIENRIRTVFGLEGTPVRMFIKEREQDRI